MPFPQLDLLTQRNFATNYTLEDSQYFSDVPIDPAIRKETDGGLVFTRKQYTRDPGRHFVTGFTELPDSHKGILDYFWTSVGGGASSFQYVHPLSGTMFYVRFEEPYAAAYKGVGGHKVWDVTSIKLRTI